MSKYTAKQYAMALFDSLNEKGANKDLSADRQALIIKRFAAILTKNYDRFLFPKIAMQLKKLERGREGRHEVVVTSARPLEKDVITDIKKKVGENSVVKETVDPAVLGGVKVLVNDELVIDGTLKTRISRLVEAVTKAVE